MAGVKGSAVLRRDTDKTEARALSDAEIAGLQAGIPFPSLTAGSDEDRELTEAELAILQDSGSRVSISDYEGKFETEDENALEEGAYLFRIGSGKDTFSGRITNVSKDREKVTLWLSNGSPRPLPRAHLMYYLGKGFLPRPPEGVTVEVPTLPCPAPGCRRRDGKPKMLNTPYQLEAHFRSRHPTDYAMRQGARASEREQKMDLLLERVVTGQGSNDQAAYLAVMQQVMANLPAETIAKLGKQAQVEGDYVMPTEEVPTGPATAPAEE